MCPPGLAMGCWCYQGCCVKGVPLRPLDVGCLTTTTRTSVSQREGLKESIYIYIYIYSTLFLDPFIHCLVLFACFLQALLDQCFDPNRVVCSTIYDVHDRDKTWLRHERSMKLMKKIKGASIITLFLGPFDKLCIKFCHVLLATCKIVGYFVRSPWICTCFRGSKLNPTMFAHEHNADTLRNVLLF